MVDAASLREHNRKGNVLDRMIALHLAFLIVKSLRDFTVMFLFANMGTQFPGQLDVTRGS